MSSNGNECDGRGLPPQPPLLRFAQDEGEERQDVAQASRLCVHDRDGHATGTTEADGGGKPAKATGDENGGLTPSVPRDRRRSFRDEGEERQEVTQASRLCELDRDGHATGTIEADGGGGKPAKATEDDNGEILRSAQNAIGADGEQSSAPMGPETGRYVTPEPIERVKTLDGMLRRMPLYAMDPARFGEECLWIQRPDGTEPEPLRLEDHQREWLIETARMDEDGTLIHKVAIASWPKREGKTMVVAVYLCWRMCTWENQRNIVLANSERQAASNIFDELLGFFRNSKALDKFTCEDDMQRRQISVSRLNNVTICYPCNFRTVQGTAVTGVLAVDELHSVPDIRPYNYLRAQTERQNSQVLVSSQAGAKHESNPVWRLYEQRHQSHIHFAYSDEHMSHWAVRLAEQQKDELVPSEYNHLHRNLWGGGGEKLFVLEQVEPAEAQWQEPKTRSDWLKLLKRLGVKPGQVVIGVGLDRAGVSRKGDRTVWTVVARIIGGADGDRYLVVMCRVLPTGAEHEILAAWRDTKAIFGRPAGILFEAYGCSDIAEKVDEAELAAPTTQRQQTLFNGLWRLFNEGRISFSSIAGIETEWKHGQKTETPGLLRRELLEFEHDASGGEGKVKFGTQSGFHDDTIYSLAWSVAALNDVTESQQAVLVMG